MAKKPTVGKLLVEKIELTKEERKLLDKQVREAIKKNIKKVMDDFTEDLRRAWISSVGDVDCLCDFTDEKYMMAMSYTINKAKLIYDKKLNDLMSKL